MASDLVLGRKAVRGPMKGMRLHPASKSGPDRGLVPITAAEYHAIRSGAVKGKATKGTVDGRRAYYRQKYERGGAVGFAQRHPLASAAGAFLGYQLLTNPAARAVGGGLTEGLKPNTQVDPYVLSVLGPGQQANPFASNSWR